MIKTRQELLEFHRALCAEALSLMDKKNQDYTGAASGEDPFFNFRRVVEEGHVSTLPKSVYVRLSDKMARISTLLSRPAAVSDEKLRDTVLDGINYLVLVLATVDDVKAGVVISPGPQWCQLCGAEVYSVEDQRMHDDLQHPGRGGRYDTPA